MKRLALILTLAVVLAGVCGVLAGPPTTKSFTDRVTGGELVVTNVAGWTDEHGRKAYELKRISFALPTAALTNAFSFTHSRRYRLPDGVWTNYSTNLITDAVSTDLVARVSGAVTFTNTYTFMSTTNDTSTQVYDGDDWGWGLTFEKGDVAVFSWTEQNAFDLIRVYDVYPRP